MGHAGVATSQRGDEETGMFLRFSADFTWRRSKQAEVDPCALYGNILDAECRRLLVSLPSLAGPVQPKPYDNYAK